MQDATQTPTRAQTTISYTMVTGSTREYHQTVYIGDVAIGEVWRERSLVVVSGLTQPRRMGLKWRWFAKPSDSQIVLGRRTRAAMLLGAGFKSKAIAAEALAGSSAPT